MAIQIGIYLFVICIIILIFLICLLAMTTPFFLKELQQLINRYTTISNSKMNTQMSKILKELSKCIDQQRIFILLKYLKEENEKIISTNKSYILTKKAESIVNWLDSFSIEQHIRELNLYSRSSQIYFDKKTNNFRLLTPK